MGLTRLARRAGRLSRERRRDAEHEGHAGERQRVECVDLEQQPVQPAGRGDGQRQPEYAAGEHQLEAARDELAG